MEIQNGIAGDILWVIQESLAHTYSQVHSALKAYEPNQIIEAINELTENGLIVVGEAGLEVCEQKLEKDLVLDELVGKKSLEQVDLTEATEFTLEMSIEEEKTTVQKNEGTAAVLEEQQEMQVAEQVPAASEDDVARLKRLREKLLQSTEKGTILNTSSITLLGLSEKTLQELYGCNIATVSDLVASFDSLSMKMDRGSVIDLAVVLAKYAEKPSFSLEDSDFDQLQILSGCNVFSFDQYGVLCSRLEEGQERQTIESLICRGELSVNPNTTFILMNFEKAFDPGAVCAVKDVKCRLADRKYPIGGESFNIYFLRAAQTSFDYGAYESEEEAVKDLYEIFEKSDRLQKACIGLVRDELLAKFDSPGKHTSPLDTKFSGEPAFVAALEKFLPVESK